MSTLGRKRTPDGQIKSINTNGEAGDGGHHETQLDPILKAWQIHRGPPDYTHARLPWVFEQNVNLNEYERDWTFRMTSPYDPYVSTSFTNINTGGGFASANTPNLFDGKGADTGTNVAFWDYYASMYGYYSVIGCRYKIRIENLSHEKFFAHAMYVTNTNPPSNASNNDMRIWKGVKSYLLHPKMTFSVAGTNVISQAEEDGTNYDDETMHPATQINQSVLNATSNTLQDQVVGNPIGSSIAYIQGEYRPGEADQQIHEDSDVSIWTSTAANPSLREALMIRVRPYDNASVPTAGDVNSYTRNFNYNVTAEVEYLVEFKELLSTIRWPTSRNPIFITVNSDPRDGGGF